MSFPEAIPTQSLTDDDIRRMRKVEIVQHLQLHGVEPSGGKGELKGQLRGLRDALLTGSRPSVLVSAVPGAGGGSASGGNGGGGCGCVGGGQGSVLDGYEEEYGAAMGGGIGGIGGIVGIGGVGSGGGGRSAGEKCVECNRKGNKLCPYKRCRACCAAHTRVQGVVCPIHYKGCVGVGINSSNGNGICGSVTGSGSGGARRRQHVVYGPGAKSERSSAGGGGGGRTGGSSGSGGGNGGDRSGGGRSGRRGGGGGSSQRNSGAGSASASASAAADFGLHVNGRRLALQRVPWQPAFHSLCK